MELFSIQNGPEKFWWELREKDQIYKIYSLSILNLTRTMRVCAREERIAGCMYLRSLTKRSPLCTRLFRLSRLATKRGELPQ